MNLNTGTVTLFFGDSPSHYLEIPDRTIGHDGIVKNGAGEIGAICDRISQAGVGKISETEAGQGEIGIGDGGAEEVTAGESPSSEIRTAEIDKFKKSSRGDRVGENRILHRGFAEIRAGEIAFGEVGAREIGLFKKTVSADGVGQVGVDEIGLKE